MKCETCGQELVVDEMTFGGRLRRSRVIAGFSKSELGTAIGFKGSSQVTRWEEGTAPIPDSVKLLTNLADVLQVELLYLMMGAPVNAETQIEGQEQLPVDRAGRVMEDADGNKIPVDDRDWPEGTPRKVG